MHPEAERPETLWPRLWRGIGVLFLAIVLYVLSVGPAHRLFLLGKLSPELMSRAYGPLLSVTKVTGLDDELLHYLDWWMPPVEQWGQPLPATRDL